MAGDSFLLIAPLMELKYIFCFCNKFVKLTFNRTAYGIEISYAFPDAISFVYPFNRTAYGIEIMLFFGLIHGEGLTFNRTAYGIEIKFYNLV